MIFSHLVSLILNVTIAISNPQGFQEALRLMKEKRFAEAWDQLEKSESEEQVSTELIAGAKALWFEEQKQWDKCLSVLEQKIQSDWEMLPQSIKQTYWRCRLEKDGLKESVTARVFKEPQLFSVAVAWLVKKRLFFTLSRWSIRQQKVMSKELLFQVQKSLLSGDLRLAEKWVRQLEPGPHHWLHLSVHAQTLEEQNQKWQAAEWLSRASALPDVPSSARAQLLERGAVLYALCGAHSQAWALAEMLPEPQQVPLKITLAYAKMDYAGVLTQAERLLHIEQSRDLSFPREQMFLGYALFQLGRFQASERAFLASYRGQKNQQSLEWAKHAKLCEQGRCGESRWGQKQ